MSNSLLIKKKISEFNKIISVSGDKSISIRWVLFSSLADGISNAQNLLLSEDVLAAINAIKKLGIKVRLSKKGCAIYGRGIKGYCFKKNIDVSKILQQVLYHVCSLPNQAAAYFHDFDLV